MNVKAEIAKGVTAQCPRQDCSIKLERGEETCMGWHGPTYDRYGNRTDHGNPNRVMFAARCERCKKTWSVRTKGEQLVDFR